ncbi:hypothetical protein BCR39DRAFT_469644, partial [Naematelia encephala]
PLVTPFILAKTLTTSFYNPFRRAQVENEAGQIMVHVKWGRERFNISIPQPSLTPLSTLLATLSNQTGLDLNQLKLIYKGAVLKDQSLTVSSYGITDGSTLVLIGKNGDIPTSGQKSASTSTSTSTVVPKKNKQPETTSESVLVEWIHNLVKNLLDPLQPSIATFISQTNPNATNRPKQIPSFQVLQKEHARLSEMLLRGLLDLDGVDIPSGWAEARKQRKDGVRRVQGELTRVDDSWGERKRVGG